MTPRDQGKGLLRFWSWAANAGKWMVQATVIFRVEWHTIVKSMKSTLLPG
jgi:hypothetical protein